MGAPLLISIAGPTASGKTATSIALAKKLNTEIISCDSRQFFKELKIGAAPPSAQELAAVKHHFIQHLSVMEPYNAGTFERDALAVLGDLFKHKSTAILVGGSGLYAQALLQGFDDLPKADDALRKKWQANLESQGIEFLQQELAIKDPEYFAVVDQENPHRLIRALEVIEQTGKTFSSQRKNATAKRPFNVINFVIDWPRAELYERINHRVDVMMEMGLEEEAKSLFLLRHLQPLNTVGYKELFHYFEGNGRLEDAVNLIKQNTRRFAKRQLTWLRRDTTAHWIAGGDVDEIVKRIEEKLPS